MAVRIASVSKSSPLYGKVKSGDMLVSVGGHLIHDLLDYRFYITERHITLSVSSSDGAKHSFSVQKEEYADLGLSFDSYLMDEQHRCKNNCIFCFIDQLPKGLRPSLYFKDDDARLSFLFGNYITLTNLSDEEVDRIIKMKISPVNVSVHTTNPALREKMMGNRFAGDSLRHLYRLADAGIKLNCQLVLCPEINDGEELTSSLDKLASLYPSMQSIACVPVGLSCHRSGLYELRKYDKESAASVVDTVETFSHCFLKEHGVRLAFAADEFYLIAQRNLPSYEDYEDFPQLENGVGMLSLFREEFLSALDCCDVPDPSKGEIHIVTGVAAYDFLLFLVDEMKKKWHNLNITVHRIENRLLGSSITVAGLLSGKDILRGLQDRSIGGRLILPRSMLRHEGDLFLDDMTVSELEQALSVKATVCDVSGDAFLHTLLQ